MADLGDLVGFLAQRANLEAGLDWLSTTLTRIRDLDQPESTLLVFFTDQHNNVQCHRYTSKEDDSTVIASTLQQLGPRVQALVLSYLDITQLDIAMLELLWRLFDVDITFLSESLAPTGLLPDSDDERTYLLRRRTYLPTQRSGRSVDLRMDLNSVALYQGTGPAIVLARSVHDQLARDAFYSLDDESSSVGIHGTKFTECIPALETMRWEYDGSRLQFLCPLVESLIEDFWVNRFLWDMSTANQPPESHDLTMLDIRSAELRAFCSNLGEFLEGLEESIWRQELQKSLKNARKLLDLYARMYNLRKHLVMQQQMQKQEVLLGEQLAETRESKAASLAVSQLTKLAFIFIPLSFTSSLLGMNLTLFGSGTIPVWGFFATSLVVLALFTLPFFSSGVILWTHMQQHLWNPLPNVLYLFPYSPRAAFWLLAFHCMHPPSNFRSGYTLSKLVSRWILKPSQDLRTVLAELRPERDAEIISDYTGAIGGHEFWRRHLESIFELLCRCLLDRDITYCPRRWWRWWRTPTVPNVTISLWPLSTTV